MNILVTGGAGFIGSNLVERLLGLGHTVVCLDNFDTYYDPEIKRRNVGCAALHKNYRLIEGDIREEESLERCFQLAPIDLVVHLAARAGVRPSLIDPELYYDVNVMGTLKILQRMRRHSVSRMVFASSSSVYGDSAKIPFSENDPVNHPISPYAASKKAGELLCHTYCHLYGFDITCLRLFTVYGPRQRPEMAIHKFVRKISRGEPIQLYGDGLTQRDYTYIDDILQGILRSIESLKGYEIINLGDSKPVPLIPLINILEGHLRRKAIMEAMPMQDGDVRQTFADITKATKLLGYCPGVTIEHGLKLFVEWYKQQATV